MTEEAAPEQIERERLLSVFEEYYSVPGPDQDEYYDRDGLIDGLVAVAAAGAAPHDPSACEQLASDVARLADNRRAKGDAYSLNAADQALSDRYYAEAETLRMASEMLAARVEPVRIPDRLEEGEAKREFRFTNEQWREYQQIPEQGYSHRHWIEHQVNEWLRGGVR